MHNLKLYMNKYSKPPISVNMCECVCVYIYIYILQIPVIVKFSRSLVDNETKYNLIKPQNTTKIHVILTPLLKYLLPYTIDAIHQSLLHPHLKVYIPFIKYKYNNYGNKCDTVTRHLSIAKRNIY